MQWDSYRYSLIHILDMKLAFKTYQKNLKRTSFATFTPPLFSVRKKEDFFRRYIAADVGGGGKIALHRMPGSHGAVNFWWSERKRRSFYLFG